ncbi:MAG TPA: hypothetical protein VGL61_23695 [Kofleriaceae bacterium]|jgi:hypothetical protein
MRTLVLALAVASGACGKADSKAPPAPSPSPGSAAVTAAPQGLAIFVGDQQVGTVPTADVAKWPRLDTLVPIEDRRLGRWEDIGLGGVKPTSVHAPSTTYPQLVPAVFPGDDGSPSFGMFDPVELANHGKPQFRADGVRDIHIKIAENNGHGQNEQGAGGGTDPTQLKLSIKTPKGEHVIDGKTLLAIPREDAPGDNGQGWPLTTILKLAGVDSYQSMVLNDANGLALNLDKSAFDPATSVPFVKLNRQGTLRFRVFKKQGDSWVSSGDIKGLVAIEILK